MTKSNTKRLRQKRLEVIDFAIKNAFVIHPGGYDYYINNFLDLSHCPCDTSRKECPCPEADEEVEEKGHCLCRLLWRDYRTYKKIQLGEDS